MPLPIAHTVYGLLPCQQYYYSHHQVEWKLSVYCTSNKKMTFITIQQIHSTTATTYTCAVKLCFISESLSSLTDSLSGHFSLEQWEDNKKCYVDYNKKNYNS